MKLRPILESEIDGAIDKAVGVTRPFPLFAVIIELSEAGYTELQIKRALSRYTRHTFHILETLNNIRA